MSRFLSFNKSDQGIIYKLFLDDSSQKTIWQAIIFYIYQVLGMYAIVLVLSKILDAFFRFEIISTNIRIILIAIIILYVISVQFILLQKKKLLYDKFNLFIVAASVLITFFIGGIVGLLPVVYFAIQKEGK